MNAHQENSKGGLGIDGAGGWETDETVEEAAMRETVEEAGVRGRLEVCVCSSWCGAETLRHKMLDALGMSHCAWLSISVPYLAPLMQEPALGAFRFMSGKPGGQGSTAASHVGCIAHMYVLHVLEELAVWPEAHERQRLWVSASEMAVMWCGIAGTGSCRFVKCGVMHVLTHATPCCAVSLASSYCQVPV